jgi:hypothetical protein
VWRLRASLVVGLFVAFLTWFILCDHRQCLHSDAAPLVNLGWIIMPFIKPGLFASIMLTGNGHTFETRAVALASVIFYFALRLCCIYGSPTAARRPPCKTLKHVSSIAAFSISSSNGLFLYSDSAECECSAAWVMNPRQCSIGTSLPLRHAFG